MELRVDTSAASNRCRGKEGREVAAYRSQNAHLLLRLVSKALYVEFPHTGVVGETLLCSRVMSADVTAQYESAESSSVDLSPQNSGLMHLDTACPLPTIYRR